MNMFLEAGNEDFEAKIHLKLMYEWGLKSASSKSTYKIFIYDYSLWLVFVHIAWLCKTEVTW